MVETTWEGDVLVGSSRERRGFDTAVDPRVSAAMVARAARLFPRVAALPAAAAWAGLRPWLPDHLPAIGPSRVVPGLWLATGHEGAGVALGPVTGPARRPALRRRAAGHRSDAVRSRPLRRRPSGNAGGCFAELTGGAVHRSVHSVREDHAHVVWDHAIEPVLEVEAGDVVELECATRPAASSTATRRSPTSPRWTSRASTR